ncbi:MAG: NUDIX hydrolase [Clostridia bacterium]|nr:NUDIX hydrolase [Clostridia bacterium]
MCYLRDENGLTLDEFLEKYDVNAYEHPSVTVDMAVFTLIEMHGRKELALLLIKRRNHPSIGMYALPGGFVEMNETISDAAARELVEETGVTGLFFRQFGTFGDLNRDPRTRVISVGHYSVAPYDSLKIQAGDDAADAMLFSVKAEKQSQDSFLVTLSGKHEFSFNAKIAYDAMGERLGSVDEKVLASDHDKIVFCALCALNSQHREDIAALLSQNTKQMSEALDALDRALGQLPACRNLIV